MKKILFAAFALLSILPSISAQKERVTFDTATKKLTILTEVEIDTAALYAKRAKLDDKITKLTALPCQRILVNRICAKRVNVGYFAVVFNE